MTTTLIQPNGQNFYFTDKELPASERFAKRAVSMSGGWGGWGSTHTQDEVLGSRPNRVRSFIENRIPFEVERGTTHIFNHEKPINPMRVTPDMDRQFRTRILMAQRVFYDTFRDELHPSIDLMCWMGGRTMQPRMSELDQFRLDHFNEACATGVLQSCKGIAIRCYPKGNSEDRQWWKLEPYIANNYAFHKAIGERYYGPDFRVMIQLSFSTFGGGKSQQLSARELAELVGWCQDAGCRDIGIWTSERDTPAGAPTYAEILAELDTLVVDPQQSHTETENGANT